MKRTLLLSLLFAGLNIFVGCQSSLNKKTFDDIKKIESKPIVLDLHSLRKVFSDADTILYEKKNPKYRLIYFMSREICSPCVIDTLYRLNSFIESTEKNSHDVDFIFIAAPQKEKLEDTYFSIESSGLKRPVYVDKDNLFAKYNKEISNNINYNIFMIDNKNNVLFVGNPQKNDKLYSLYKKIISL